MRLHHKSNLDGLIRTNTILKSKPKASILPNTRVFYPKTYRLADPEECQAFFNVLRKKPKRKFIMKIDALDDKAHQE